MRAAAIFVAWAVGIALAHKTSTHTINVVNSNGDGRIPASTSQIYGCSTKNTGAAFFDTVEKKLKVCNGETYISVGADEGIAGIVKNEDKDHILLHDGDTVGMNVGLDANGHTRVETKAGRNMHIISETGVISVEAPSVQMYGHVNFMHTNAPRFKCLYGTYPNCYHWEYITPKSSSPAGQTTVRNLLQTGNNYHWGGMYFVITIYTYYYTNGFHQYAFDPRSSHTTGGVLSEIKTQGHTGLCWLTHTNQGHQGYASSGDIYSGRIDLNIREYSQCWVKIEAWGNLLGNTKFNDNAPGHMNFRGVHLMMENTPFTQY